MNVPVNPALALPSWLQRVLDNTTDAVIIADPEFRVVKWNPALEQLLPPDTAITGAKMPELLHALGDLTCDIENKIRQAVNNGLSENDIMLAGAGGKKLQLSCHVHRLPDTNTFSAIVVIIQQLQKPVTPAPTSVQNADFIYSSYLENSPAPAWIADEDGYSHFINSFARRIWKLDNSYKNKHLREIFPENVVGKFIATDRRVLETGKPLAFVIESIRLDGSMGFYMLHKFLLPAKNGKRLIAGQAIDITAEKQAEEAFRKSSERFSYVAKAVSDCIWDWDIETGKIYRSEALMTLTGYSLEDIQDTTDWWKKRTHPRDRKESIDKLKGYINQGNLYCDAEYRFLCADNKYRLFSDKGYVVYKDGKPVRAIGVVQDITERKKLEEKLLHEKIEKTKEIAQAVLAAQDNVSNELGEELHDNVNQILSTANLMLDCAGRQGGKDKEEFIKKSKEYILLAIMEIRKICKSLNSSRIKEQLLGPVEEIVSNLRQSLQIDARFDYDEEIEELLSTEQKLMAFRIIQEQTNNIIKYAEATEVTISVNKKGNSFHLLIKDDGKGFDLKTARNGVGLTNIRSRVQAFNGSLHIVTSPGQGCALDILIPLKRTALRRARGNVSMLKKKAS